MSCFPLSLRGPMPTVLIAVSLEHRERLERSLFWRSDMRRTFAAPSDVVTVARTLGPDVVIVMPHDGTDADTTREALATLRREPATRDSVVVLLKEHDAAGAPLVVDDPATVVLPPDFG